MVRNICVIDDSIPLNETVDDTICLNRSVLRFLLQNEESWREVEVMNLIKDLCNDADNWNISAFTNPNIYLNAVHNDNYCPDIIIYDWDFPIADKGSEELLLKTLQNTFSIVYVYTREDHRTKVEETLGKSEFSAYVEKRLFVLMKDEQDSPCKLQTKVVELYEKNFSFRFGHEIRCALVQALEQVLIEFGKVDANFVTKLLNDDELQETDIKEIITEKVGHKTLENDKLIRLLTGVAKFTKQTALNCLSNIQSKLSQILKSKKIRIHDITGDIQNNEINQEPARELWYLRLYYHPYDDIVRKGDIISAKNENKTFLVISSDCHLAYFWDKNFGYLSIIPLFDICKEKDDIYKIFSLTKDKNKINQIMENACSNSLITKIDGSVPDGVFILPFLKLNNSFHYFMGFPKLITSISVIPPNPSVSPPAKKNDRLTYSNLNEYERIGTISEPFLTPLIQLCIKELSGYGVPDYPRIVKDSMKGDIASFWNEPPS